MAIVRWDPSRELDSFQSEFNRLFDSFLGNGGRADVRARRWVPAIDLVETDGALVLKADLPGLTEDDIAIEVKDDVLTVSGERRSDHEEKTGGYRRVERSFGRFSRSLSLPQGVDADSISADFSDGVLEIRIPKPEERTPHRVEIGTGSVNGTATEK